MKTITQLSIFITLALLLFIGNAKVNAQALTVSPNPVDMGNAEVNQLTESYISISDADPTAEPNASSISSVYFTNDTNEVFQQGNYFYDSSEGTGVIGIGINPPTEGVTYTATLNIEVNETGGTQTYQIPVTAFSVPAEYPELVVSDLEFTTIHVNTTASQNLVLTNNGTEDLSISDINIDTSSETSFSITEPTYPLIITPGNTYNLPVNYAPVPLVGGNTVDEFNRATTLTITSNDYFNSTTDVDITGSVFASDPDYSNTNFGNVLLGQTVTGTNTITNDGEGELFIDNIYFSAYSVGNDATADFSLTNAPTYPLVLAQDESFTANLEFTPNATSFRRVNMHYVVKNHTGASIPVTIEGVGVQPEISFPNQINFESVRVGESDSFTLQIQNPGSADTNISALTITGNNANLFSIQNNEAQTIAAGESIDIVINFTDTVEGGKTAQLNFTSNVSSSPHTISVLANSITSHLTADVSTITFEETLVGQSSTATTVTLSNNFGTDEVTISDIIMPSSDFSVSGITTPITIAAGSSTTFTVQATPQQAGHILASATILSNDAKSPLELELIGSGIAPSYELNRTLISFLDTKTGRSRTELFSVTNNGTADLEITNGYLVNAGCCPQFGVTNVFPLTIAPDQEGIIPVQFSPYSSGNKTITMRVETNAGNFDIQLNGKALSPRASISKFGEFPEQIPVGGEVTRNFSIKNWGEGTLEITGFNIVEAGTSNTSTEAYINATFPIIIEEDQSHVLEIVANPSTDGYKNIEVQVQGNNTNNESEIWSFTALNIAVFNGNAVTQATDVEIGQTSYTPYTINNTGSGTMVIYSDNVPLYQSGGTFSIPENSSLPAEWNTYNNFPATINAGSSLDILIAYTPTNVSAYGEIALKTGPILNNANVGGYDYSVKIAAYGGALIPELTVINAQPLTYLETSVSRTSTQTITIQNTGTTDLLIENTYGDGVFMFADQGSLEDIILGVGETMDFDINFSPDVIGAVNGYFGFVTNVEGTYVIVNTTGIGVEPAEIVVNGLTFEADRTTDLGDGKYLLSGNVHAGKMEFSKDVTVDLVANTASCQCRVFSKNIAEVGEYGGEEVDLMEGEIAFKVEEDDDGDPYINAALFGATTGVSTFFTLVGIPIEFSKFELITGSDPGIEVGGSLDLPADVFGPEVNVTIDRLQIVESGVNIEGSSTITGDPAVKILNTFELHNAAVNFNTFENSFGGEASIKLALLGRSTSIDGAVQIINGGLESASLEVEVSPGIPLASTGWELSGGNGSISGIQIPPLSIAMGVDLKPISPIDILKLDNMQLKYTFGTSLEASGTVLVLNQEVGGGSILVNNLGLNAKMFANVYDVFKGDVSLLVENRPTGLFTEGEADMSVTIPEVPVESCSICEVVNNFLPLTVAELKAKINNTEFKTKTTIAEILTVNVGVEFGGNVKIGGNFGIISFGDSRYLPPNSYYEYNEDVNNANPLEGRSLIVSTAANRSSTTQVPFNLSQSYKNIIVRVEGTTAYPNATLTLPNGTVLTSENATSNSALYTESTENFRVFYIMKDTQVGAFEINIDGAGPYEVDIFGASFAPEIEITNVAYNNSTKQVTIDWTDQDIDSNAEVALYYDTDGKNADGKQIVAGILEDDNTDQYVFDASNLVSGTYHIYAKIADDANPAIYNYASTTFTVNNESPVGTPTLIGELIDNVFELSWNPVKEADHYVVYTDEEEVTLYSKNQSVGSASAFDFTEIEPGRTYKFGVTAMKKELDGSYTESNLSNIVEFVFVSPDKNNKPKIETNSLADVTDPCNPYSFTINYSDPDATDTLVLSMPTHPTGMTLTGNTINWTPTADQIGKHQVILNVNDGNGGTDQKSLVITVFEANSAPKPNLVTLPVIEADCSVTLTAPTATDDCSGTITATTTNATTYNLAGEYIVNWVYEDTSGNQATQQQRVVVTDTELPSVVCQNISVMLDETTNSVTISPNQLNNGSTDNCTAANDLTLSLSEDTFTSEGTYSVTLTVEDANGNSNTCTAQVIVQSSLSTQDFEINKVVLYPNPNINGIVYLKIPDNVTIKTINVYDISGRVVKTINQLKNNQINIQNLSSGTYLFKLTSLDGSTTKQLIKK